MINLKIELSFFILLLFLSQSLVNGHGKVYQPLPRIGTNSGLGCFANWQHGFLSGGHLLKKIFYRFYFVFNLIFLYL